MPGEDAPLKARRFPCCLRELRCAGLEFLHLTGRPADGELLDSCRRTEPKMDEARQDHVHMAIVVEIRERHRADAFEFGGNAGTGGGVFEFPAAERKIKSRAFCIHPA